MNVHMITLGCKVNQYESQAICAMMEQCGFTAQDAPEGADVTWQVADLQQIPALLGGAL